MILLDKKNPPIDKSQGRIKCYHCDRKFSFFYLLAGAPVSLTGAPEVGFGLMLPLILITFVGVLTAFEVIVTDLLMAPGRLVSYFTEISAVAPGAIGSFGQDGTVHPQDPFAFDIIKGAFPVFLKLNVLPMNIPTATAIPISIGINIFPFVIIPV